MRISDWSSDVCSSDLRAAFFGDIEPDGVRRLFAGPAPGSARLALLLGHCGVEPRPVHRQILGAKRVFGQVIGKAVGVIEAKGDVACHGVARLQARSEEHTAELQSPMRTSYAVFCLK